MFKFVSVSVAAAAAVVVATSYLDHQTGSGQAPAFLSKTEKPAASGPTIAAITADASGHFMVAALVNGVHVDMLADTGATAVVLTLEDAERIGMDQGWLDYDVRVQTANGIAEAAEVTLDYVTVGQVEVRDVRALVVRPGALARSLLGMSFIGALTRFELKGDQLVLVQ